MEKGVSVQSPKYHNIRRCLESSPCAEHRQHRVDVLVAHIAAHSGCHLECLLQLTQLALHKTLIHGINHLQESSKSVARAKKRIAVIGVRSFRAPNPQVPSHSPPLASASCQRTGPPSEAVRLRVPCRRWVYAHLVVPAHRDQGEALQLEPLLVIEGHCRSRSCGRTRRDEPQDGGVSPSSEAHHYSRSGCRKQRSLAAQDAPGSGLLRA